MGAQQAGEDNRNSNIDARAASLVVQLPVAVAVAAAAAAAAVGEAVMTGRLGLDRDLADGRKVMRCVYDSGGCVWWVWIENFEVMLTSCLASVWRSCLMLQYSHASTHGTSRPLQSINQSTRYV